MDDIDTIQVKDSNTLTYDESVNIPTLGSSEEY